MKEGKVLIDIEGEGVFTLWNLSSKSIAYGDNNRVKSGHNFWWDKMPSFVVTMSGIKYTLEELRKIPHLW